MDVLKEILNWSKSRPDWQRDALRRLVISGELDEGDIEELTEICKSTHGLTDEQTIIPLDNTHIASTKSNTHKVNLQSIYHHSGVNALAENQKLNFGPSLTVVYGDNAAGKSGYTRILKSACRARGDEDILGNVLSGTTPLKPAVSIKYTIDDEPDPYEWSGGDDNEDLSRVSVFDSHSAAVYLTSRTDVAFRPFGLDLFDKLSKACLAIKSKLERDRISLNISRIQSLQLPEGTSAAKLVANLSSLTDPEKVKSVGTLSNGEKENLNLLEKKLLDLQTNDPAKTAKELMLRESRYQTLHTHLKDLDELLSPSAVDSLISVRAEVKTKGDTAIKLRQATFPEDVLTDTGSDAWLTMWEAAREFSKTNAYPGVEFPFTEDDARCLLCQQDLKPETVKRLIQFETFVKSAAESELRTVKDKYLRLCHGLEKLEVLSNTTKTTINEIRIDDEELANEVSTTLINMEVRRAKISESLQQLQGLPSDFPGYVSVTDKIEKLVKQTHHRVKELQKHSDPDQKGKISNEVMELKSRKMLGENETHVLAEIERKKKLAAYGLCRDDTNTQSITMKSTAVTKVVVTDQLKKTFKEELVNLSFKHVDVELAEVGGERGNLYHKMVLTMAPGVELPKVVSEGEARCLSIAAFFAELSTTEYPSAILFDDPVSSLDYKWRSGVALRLVQEAKTRQVIVFTHDIVFLLLLHQFSEEQSIDILDQHIRQLNIGAGVCTEELPWVALKVSRRIGHLKSELQEAEKLHKEGHDKLYEQKASYIYGLLREAWERGIEEVLFNGIVERYRSGVQTQQIKKISDISNDDCNTVDIAMTKCSKWLSGHDQSPAAKEDIPEPNELKTDIGSLENWITGIRKRRK